MDFEEIDVFTMVTLTDRTMQGGCEITFDHKPLVWKPGQIDRGVPMFVAEWLYTASNGDKHKVWTTAGDYTHRFGVKDAPESLIARCGEHITDCSPIEIDPTAVEGTDVRLIRDADERMVPQAINVPRSELTEKQGAGRNAGALAGR